MGAAALDTGAEAERSGGLIADRNVWPDMPADVRQVGERARRYVAKESPSSAFPFATASPAAGGTIVMAHYFPPYPLMIDPKPADQDYYARNYLRPEGENGKFAAEGGLLRDRPLPVPAAASDRKLANLAIEIARAARIGIDAFGVDILGVKEGASRSVSRDLLDAAAATDAGFAIIPQPDMTALTGITVTSLADALDMFAKHPAGYRLKDGRLLVMPFHAESRNLQFWRALMQEMARRGEPIAFAPVFVSPGAMSKTSSIAWGASAWGDAGPDGAARTQRLAATAAKQGIERWFYDVSPQDYRPKFSLYWETRNTEGYRKHWESAIGKGTKYITIVTWNDYSESTEISPSAVSQFVFYDLTAYYVAWLKQGRAPAIQRDVLYWMHRRQIFEPRNKHRGRVVRDRGHSALANDIELVAFLTKPGQLTIVSGGKRVSRHVGAGLQTLRLAASVGTPEFMLSRDGRTIISRTSDWNIRADPSRHNAIYAGGSSSRDFIEVPKLGD